MNIYELVKVILYVVAVAGCIAFWIGAIPLMIMLFRRNPDFKKRRTYAAAALAGIAVGGIAMLASFAVAVKQYSQFDLESCPEFEVTSSNLTDGKWDAVITNTEQGQNESPGLQWQSVAGATAYAVIMVDPDGNNWLHWVAVTDKTSFVQGEYTGDVNGYVGPYPPSGTHRYIIYVFALKDTPYTLTESVDAAGANVEKIAQELNSSPQAEYNNILAVGKIEGTYSVQ